MTLPASSIEEPLLPRQHPQWGDPAGDAGSGKGDARRGGSEAAISDQPDLEVTFNDLETGSFLSFTNMKIEGHGLFTAVCFVIANLIGGGVLPLPLAISWTGYVAGPAAIMLFFVIALWCARMEARVFECKGTVHPTYMKAVKEILGTRHARVVGAIQHVFFFIVTVGNMTVAASSLALVARAAGHPHAAYHHALLLFGAAQLLLSLLPDMRSLWWLSIVGAALSVGYTVLGIFIAVTSSGIVSGSLWVAATPCGTYRLLACLKALGNMAFVYGLGLNLLEVEATLGAPPSRAVTMSKASSIGMTIAVTLYLGYGCLVRAASGQYAYAGFRAPDWLLTPVPPIPQPPGALAVMNVLIAATMLPACQLKSQATFEVIEKWLAKQGLPNAVHAHCTWRRLGLRVGLRYTYMGLAIGAAAVLPSPSTVLGLAGAIAFAPLIVVYPIELYMKMYEVTRAGFILRRATQILAVVVSVAAAVGVAGSGIAQFVTLC